jgi:hypothetical protein
MVNTTSTQTHKFEFCCVLLAYDTGQVFSSQVPDVASFGKSGNSISLQHSTHRYAMVHVRNPVFMQQLAAGLLPLGSNRNTIMRGTWQVVQVGQYYNPRNPALVCWAATFLPEHLFKITKLVWFCWLLPLTEFCAFWFKLLSGLGIRFRVGYSCDFWLGANLLVHRCIFHVSHSKCKDWERALASLDIRKYTEFQMFNFIQLHSFVVHFEFLG